MTRFLISLAFLTVCGTALGQWTIGGRIMTGATSGAAGGAGYAPAPAAGDQAKFLRADGTWQSVSAESSLPTAPGNGYVVFRAGGAWSTKAESTLAVDASSVVGLVDTVYLQNRVEVLERNDAMTRFALFSHAGLPGAAWEDAWTSMNQDYTNDWPTITGAYWEAVKKALCTQTPGTSDVTGTTGWSSGSGTAANAGDGDTGTVVDISANNNYVAGAMITWDAGVGVTFTPTSVAIWRVKEATFIDAWKAWGSNNNTDWTELGEQTGLADHTNPEKVTMLFANTTAYRYLRVAPKGTGCSGLGWIDISEVEWYAPSTSAVTLRSATTTSTYSPTTGSVFFVTKDLVAGIVAGDFTASITKDSFAHSTAVTLSKWLTVGAFSYWYGEGTYPTGTGTAVGIEIVTPAKELEVYGGTTYWRP